MANFPHKTLKFFATRPLSQVTLFGIALGVLFGIGSSRLEPNSEMITLMNFPGELFINCLKMVVLLFVIVIMTRTPMDMKELLGAKKFAAFVLAYYIFTTLCSSLIGLGLVNLIRPGSQLSGCDAVVSGSPGQTELTQKTLSESILNIFRKALPSNIFATVVQDNILGVLVIFLSLGFYMATYSDTANGRTMKRLLDLLYQTTLDVLALVISFTPVGVFALVASQMAVIKDSCVYAKMGIFIATFLLANVVHVVVVFPIIFISVVRANPLTYIRNFLPAIITAFSTASSAASLPLNLKAAYEMGIDKNTVNFVLPLGSTLNMNGSSIYFPVTVLFVCIMYEQPLHISTQLLLCVISTFVTIGSAPVPSGALVYLTVITSSISVKLPQEVLSLIWAIDPLMDRVLTMTNVIGDSFAVKIIDSFHKRYLLKGEKCEGIEELSDKEVSQNVKERELSNSTLSMAKKMVEKSTKTSGKKV